MFSLLFVWKSCWTNKRVADDFQHHYDHIDGLMQDCSITIANATEILQFTLSRQCDVHNDCFPNTIWALHAFFYFCFLSFFFFSVCVCCYWSILHHESNLMDLWCKCMMTSSFQSLLFSVQSIYSLQDNFAKIHLPNWRQICQKNLLAHLAVLLAPGGWLLWYVEPSSRFTQHICTLLNFSSKYFLLGFGNNISES